MLLSITTKLQWFTYIHGEWITLDVGRELKGLTWSKGLEFNEYIFTQDLLAPPTWNKNIHAFSQK